MAKPTLTNFRQPAIAAGGIMAISLSVLLVCSLAADGGLVREVLPEERTCIPNMVTIDMPFLGLAEFDGAVTLNGVNQNLYAAFVSLDICWRLDRTLRGSLQTYSDASYCSSGSSCSGDMGNMGECPKHALEFPTFPRGDCQVIGLSRSSDLCTEHSYSASAELQAFPAQKTTSSNSEPVQTETLPSVVSTDRALPTCPSQCSQPENVSQEGQDLPIRDTNLGHTTAWRAKVGEIAVRNQAEENWDGKDKKRRLRRLGRLIIGLLVIALVMWVF